MLVKNNIKLSELISYPDEPKLDKEGYDDMIRHELQRRRSKGHDSMWLKIGIKYMGDRKLWKKMYGWEIDYYMKHHKGVKQKETRGDINED